MGSGKKPRRPRRTSPKRGDPPGDPAPRGPISRDERIRRAVLRATEVIRRLGRERARYRDDHLRLVRENRRLRSAVEKQVDLSLTSSTFKGGLGGRTAIEAYSGNLGSFMQHMNELGAIALVDERRARFYLQTVILRDLELIYAAPAPTLEEGQRRAHVEHRLVSETRVLASPTEAGELARQEFIHQALRAGTDTSTQELVRRSADTSAIPERRAPSEP